MQLYKWAGVLFLGLFLLAGHSFESFAQPAQTDVAKGKKIFKTLGCAACHSTDGSTRVGPTLQGTWGTRVRLTTGKMMTRDVAYLKKQLWTPKQVLVPGYPPVMPSYKKRLKEAGIVLLAAYIRSLNSNLVGAPKAAPRLPAKVAARPTPRQPTKVVVKAAQPKPKPRPKPRSVQLSPQQKKQLAIGRHYYQTNCSFCHGVQGKGDGPGGRSLSVGMKDFAKGQFLYGDNPNTIFGIITNGSPRTKLMPAWNHLTQRTRWALVAYLRSLKK